MTLDVVVDGLIGVDECFRRLGGESTALQQRFQGCVGGRFGEEAFELRLAEVGDADRFRLAAFEGLFHGFPGVDVVRVARLDLVVLLGHEGVAPGEGGGPVHEVEVEVVRAQVFEGGVDGRFDVVRVVRVVPELGRDEDFGAGDAAFLDGCADGGFGPVDASCVYVAVACFQGFCHGCFLSACILPCSKANGRCDCSL